MLTVLIYQKESQDYLNRYKYLFDHYEESGQIAFCFWDENGVDVQTALPELNNIVRGVREWKAIVVMPHLEGFQEELLLHHPENPFDYYCNSKSDPGIVESKVPLIRLSQMLGGVPLVDKHYFESFKTENSDSPAEIFNTENNDYINDQERKWQELNDKYSLRIDKPQYLYLLKARLRRADNLPFDIEKSNEAHFESDSSLFWYRNRYPARARFLIQDCASPENVHYLEDLFRFWMTALTIAINEFPSGTFEAYKVYQTVSTISLEKLNDLFSQYYNRLASIQYRSKLQIIELQKQSQFVREKDALPAYKFTVPVSVDGGIDTRALISTKEIGLSGDCPKNELQWWNSELYNSINTVKKVHSAVQLGLDRASIQCRYSSKMNDEEIFELDEYQIEELEQELSELEKIILGFNAYQIYPFSYNYKKLKDTGDETRNAIEKRMTKKGTIVAGIFMLVIFLIGFIPDLIYREKGTEMYWNALKIDVLGHGVLFIVIFLCLFYFRGVIKGKIKQYNKLVDKIIDNLLKAENSFSDYLTHCCSYMRGKYLLKVLTDQTLISTEEIIQLEQHSDHLQFYLEKIENWLSDFDMKVLEDKVTHAKDYFDFDIPPEKNRGYSIQMDIKDTYIESVGGSECKAPYPFVTEFKVKRESLFENKK